MNEKPLSLKQVRDAVKHAADEKALSEPSITNYFFIQEKHTVIKVNHNLTHISNQIEKRQYWNAIATCNELMKNLLICFNCVLKKRYL